MENTPANRVFIRKLIDTKKMSTEDIFSYFPDISKELEMYISAYCRNKRKWEQIKHFKKKKKTKLKNYKILQEEERQGNRVRMVIADAK